MATMIVRHKVNDFKAWKSVFDEMDSTRRNFGWTAHEVLRSSSDPNDVMIINKAKTVDQCLAYGQSPELKAAMQRAGIAGVPEIVVFNEEENLVY